MPPIRWVVCIFGTHSRLVCEWVTSNMCMSHVTHVNESWHAYEWVMSHTWMSHVSHVTCMIESCHTCKWAMSHLWMCHGTHVKESHVHATNSMCHVKTTNLRSYLNVTYSHAGRRGCGIEEWVRECRRRSKFVMCKCLIALHDSLSWSCFDVTMMRLMQLHTGILYASSTHYQLI